MLRPKRPDGDVGRAAETGRLARSASARSVSIDRVHDGALRCHGTFGGEVARGQAPVRCSTSSRLRAGEAQVRPRTSACKGSPEMKDAPVRRRGNRARAQASVASWSLAIWCLSAMGCPGNRAGRRPVRETLVRQVFAPASSHRMHHRIGPAPGRTAVTGPNNPAVVARDRRGLASMRPFTADGLRPLPGPDRITITW